MDPLRKLKYPHTPSWGKNLISAWSHVFVVFSFQSFKISLNNLVMVMYMYILNQVLMRFERLKGSVYMIEHAIYLKIVCFQSVRWLSWDSVYQSQFFSPQIYVSLLYIWFSQHLGFHRRPSIIFEVVFLLGENSPRSWRCLNQSSNHLNAKLNTSHLRKYWSNLFTIKRCLTTQKGYEYKKNHFLHKRFPSCFIQKL